jgi:predicted aspartyl protease
MGDCVQAVGGPFPTLRGLALKKETSRVLSGSRIRSTAGPGTPFFGHDSGDFTIPVSVDGKLDDFLFDTGAWHSVMTARMAARLE